MANNVLSKCKELFQQAGMLAPGATRVSFPECRDFLVRAGELVSAQRSAATRVGQGTVDECRHFLEQAEQLKPARAGIADYKTFLAEAEQVALEYWKRQIEYLREADPRKDSHFETVNLLSVFGISRRESPHSRFLGWLLDPEGSHGLGTAILIPFLALAQTTRGYEFEIELREVTIELERSTDKGVPDITITGSNFMCVVENKILAAEGQDQTRRYADATEQEARERQIPADHVLLIFLSPEGREPRDSRFSPVSYGQVLRLLEATSTAVVSPLVATAIRQFVFNLRAVVLNQYDREMAILAHLKGYEATGDVYLREHSHEISELVLELEGVENMADFDGFSQLSILYADKYDLVEAMEEAFERERKTLFQDFQNTIAGSPWFDTRRMTMVASGPRVRLRLQNPESEERLARILVYLDATRLGTRQLYSDLWLYPDLSDMRGFRRRFVKAAGEQLIEMFDVADYKTSGRYLVRRRSIPFEPETILDTMLDEVEKLRQFFPVVEELLLDVLKRQT